MAEDRIHMDKPDISPFIIGENLRLARIANGFSVGQVADYLGVSQEHSIYRYEEGKGFPSPERLLLLMWRYRVGADQLILGGNAQNGRTGW